MKICEKICVGPSPPHLDKIQKNSNFFRETFPEPQQIMMNEIDDNHE